MSRPHLLPLPDASVRHILSQIDDIRATFPVSRGNRPFLAAFLRLVYEATGEIFGATITRKLLQTYAPEYKPSTVTIHDEILALRDALAQGEPTHGSDPNRSGTDVSASSTPSAGTGHVSSLVAGLERVLSRMTAAVPDSEGGDFYKDALIRGLESENQRLREHGKHLQSQVETLRQRQQTHDNQLLAMRTERDTLAATVDQLTERINQLTQALETNNARVDASHRLALSRIESAGTELRFYKDKLAEEQKRAAEAMKKYQDELAMSDALRQALNKVRAERVANDGN